MNCKNEYGQYLLARNSLGWITLEERRVQMKARLNMYKSINKFAPQRQSNFFQNSNYDLRGSSTTVGFAFPGLEQNI
jgi:hypothetical protein